MLFLLWWIPLAVYFYSIAWNEMFELSNLYRVFVTQSRKLDPYQSGLHNNTLLSASICQASDILHQWFPEVVQFQNSTDCESKGYGLMDMKDIQWNSFRKNIVYIATMLLCFTIGNRLITYIFSQYFDYSAREIRIWIDIIFSIIFAAIIHGFTGFLVLQVILSINFVSLVVFERLSFNKTKILNAFIWIYPFSILIFNTHFMKNSVDSDTEEHMRDYHYIPWNITYPFLFLRMISFSIDTNQELTSQQKFEESRMYTFRTFRLYYLYIFYPPLYLAGPIVTFRDFRQAIYKRRDSTNIWSSIKADNFYIVKYMVRYFFCFVLFELLNHFLYVGALIKMSFGYEVWKLFALERKYKYVPLLMHLTGNGRHYKLIFFFGYWSIVFIWFKLLLIWRFGRIFSLLDGMPCDENMQRCVNNNFTFNGFWKYWHVSFRKWLIQYIYIPLGGSKHGHQSHFLNILAVFLVVGVWHDIEFKLLLWSVGLGVIAVPELFVRYIFNKGKDIYENKKQMPSDIPARIGYRLYELSRNEKREIYSGLLSIGGGIEIMLLKLVNLSSFSLGIDGMKLLFGGLFSSSSGLLFLLWYFVNMCLASYGMIQFEKMKSKTSYTIKYEESKA